MNVRMMKEIKLTVGIAGDGGDRDRGNAEGPQFRWYSSSSTQK